MACRMSPLLGVAAKCPLDCIRLAEHHRGHERDFAKGLGRDEGSFGIHAQAVEAEELLGC